MKKLLVLLITASLLVSLCACGKTNGESESTADATTKQISDDVINITEKMFVTYINEIYTNTSDYIGKTIKIEGMFDAYHDETSDITYYYVYRTGPGCCGNDGSMCGFEFTYNGKMPKEKDWIEVVGKLRTYKDGPDTYLTLDAQTVTIKDQRGSEIVYN